MPGPRGPGSSAVRKRGAEKWRVFREGWIDAGIREDLEVPGSLLSGDAQFQIREGIHAGPREIPPREVLVHVLHGHGAFTDG